MDSTRSGASRTGPQCRVRRRRVWLLAVAVSLALLAGLVGTGCTQLGEDLYAKLPDAAAMDAAAPGDAATPGDAGPARDASAVDAAQPADAAMLPDAGQTGDASAAPDASQAVTQPGI